MGRGVGRDPRWGCSGSLGPISALRALTHQEGSFADGRLVVTPETSLTGKRGSNRKLLIEAQERLC